MTHCKHGENERGKKAMIVSGRDTMAKAEVGGIARGTIVLTLDGALPVEHLMPGDRIITRNSGSATLSALRCHSAPRPTCLIRPNVLGFGRPEGAVITSADQKILLRDWRARALWGADQVLVPVSKLVDGEFITDAGLSETPLFELLFESPQVIYAGGLELGAGIAADAVQPA